MVIMPLAMGAVLGGITAGTMAASLLMYLYNSLIGDPKRQKELLEATTKAEKSRRQKDLQATAMLMDAKAKAVKKNVRKLRGAKERQNVQQLLAGMLMARMQDPSRGPAGGAAAMDPASLASGGGEDILPPAPTADMEPAASINQVYGRYV